MKKRITFEQFIKTYNFRYVNRLNRDNVDNDTCIIRIYPPTRDFDRDKWFEFGVYDFGRDDYKWEICKEVLSKEILKSYVECISYNEDYNVVVTIHLTKNENYE